MFTRRFDDKDDALHWDRTPIRLDPALSQEGIAASLRRAFNAVPSSAQTDRDFEELLARLI